MLVLWVVTSSGFDANLPAEHTASTLRVYVIFGGSGIRACVSTNRNQYLHTGAVTTEVLLSTT
jgi:hypothetical protein